MRFFSLIYIFIFLNFNLLFLFLFALGEVVRAEADIEGWGDEWNWGACYEIRKESMKSKKKTTLLSCTSGYLLKLSET